MLLNVDTKKMNSANVTKYAGNCEVFFFFFWTLSLADLRWNELMETISKI